MTSRRCGLSEPRRETGNAFRMGTVIRIGIEGRPDASMMISALITRDAADEAIYALLTAHSRVQDYDGPLKCKLVRGPGQPRITLGTLVLPNEVLGDDGDKLGFHILRLEATPLFGDVRQHAKSLATVRNFRNGIWSAGTVRVRRLNDARAFTETATQWRNRGGGVYNRKGRVAGEMPNVEIEDLGKTLEFSYCGLVTRGRHRPLGDPRAHGAPLISESGALSAIIVGAADQDTLVYPVEELRKGRSIEFVTLGDDWPKLKVSPKQRAVA